MLWSLLIGLIVGVVAKFLMPGKDPGGFIITALLGVFGAGLAHWLGTAMGMYAPNEPAGFIAAVIGSMILLGIYRMFFAKKLA